MAHLRELALFAGAGGGILGGKLLGWRTVCAVEIEPYCREVLMRRQDEGHLAPFPIWDDVRTFDGTEWRGKVDVVSGGFPCQAFSTAARGAHTAKNLWPEMLRIVREARPRFVFAENVVGSSRIWGGIRRDLASNGYSSSRPVSLGTSDVGGPCDGQRYWLLATTDGNGEPDSTKHDEVAHVPPTCACDWWRTDDPRTLGVANGVANRLDRLKAAGNGQDPAVAAAAWRILGGP